MASVATLRDLTDALVKSSVETDGLARVIEDLEALFDILGAHESLRKVLSTSAFKVEERKAIARDVGNRAGFSELTQNFIGLVIEMGKIKGLINSAQPVLRKLRKASGKIRAEITLASQPSFDEVRRIRDALALEGRGEIEVVVSVDPAILGGVLAKVEDKVYDGTLRTQLRRLKGALSL